MVIEFWAFFHPESHYWPPPESDLICTEYLECIKAQASKIEFVGKKRLNIFMRPFLSTLLRFFAAVQTEFLVQFMSLLAFGLSLSPALFSPEFNVIKKRTHSQFTHSKNSLCPVCGLESLKSKKRQTRQTEKTHYLDFSWFRHYGKRTMRSIMMQIWDENWWIWLLL